MVTHSNLAWKIPQTEEPAVRGAAKSWTRLSALTESHSSRWAHSWFVHLTSFDESIVTWVSLEA